MENETPLYVKDLQLLEGREHERAVGIRRCPSRAVMPPDRSDGNLRQADQD